MEAAPHHLEISQIYYRANNFFGLGDHLTGCGSAEFKKMTEEGGYAIHLYEGTKSLTASKMPAQTILKLAHSLKGFDTLSSEALRGFNDGLETRLQNKSLSAQDLACLVNGLKSLPKFKEVLSQKLAEHNIDVRFENFIDQFRDKRSLIVVIRDQAAEVFAIDNSSVIGIQNVHSYQVELLEAMNAVLKSSAPA